MSPQRGGGYSHGKTLIPPDNGIQEGGKAGADPTGDAGTPREWCPTTIPQTRGTGGAGILMTDALQGPSMTPPQGGARDTGGKRTQQGAKAGADPTGEAITPAQPLRERCPPTIQ